MRPWESSFSLLRRDITLYILTKSKLLFYYLFRTKLCPCESKQAKKKWLSRNWHPETEAFWHWDVNRVFRPAPQTPSSQRIARFLPFPAQSFRLRLVSHLFSGRKRSWWYQSAFVMVLTVYTQPPYLLVFVFTRYINMMFIAIYFTIMQCLNFTGKIFFMPEQRCSVNSLWS